MKTLEVNSFDSRKSKQYYASPSCVACKRSDTECISRVRVYTSFCRSWFSSWPTDTEISGIDRTFNSEPADVNITGATVATSWPPKTARTLQRNKNQMCVQSKFTFTTSWVSYSSKVTSEQSSCCSQSKLFHKLLLLPNCTASLSFHWWN